MNHLQTVEGIVFDRGMSVPEKAERVISFFAELPGRGLSAAADCLVSTDDERVASFVATHLQMLPGGRDEKTLAARSLRSKGAPLVRAAARLVPWLPDELLSGFVADYLSAPEPSSPRSSVVFSIALYRPELVRPFADRIEDDSIQRSLLSGAPDVLADAFLQSWKETDDIDVLHALSLMRTKYAADLIQSLREELEDPDDREALMELAGRLPEGGASGFGPSFMGFVVGRGESLHVMGGAYAGVVPLCPECQSPAERVLTLAADSTPFGLSADPSFFWYSCDCFAMDSTTVRMGDGGRRVYFGPEGPAAAESRLIPGARCMALETHPNQTGISLEAIPGQFRHQVGGLPRWVDADLHPVCPECGKSMPFLASVDSGHTPFGPIGFGGTLFCFWCNDCKVSSTKYQS